MWILGEPVEDINLGRWVWRLSLCFGVGLGVYMILCSYNKIFQNTYGCRWEKYILLHMNSWGSIHARLISSTSLQGVAKTGPLSENMMIDRAIDRPLGGISISRVARLRLMTTLAPCHQRSPVTHFRDSVIFYGNLDFRRTSASNPNPPTVGSQHTIIPMVHMPMCHARRLGGHSWMCT